MGEISSISASLSRTCKRRMLAFWIPPRTASPRSPSEAASDGDRGDAVLGGIQNASILRLHVRLKLAEIEDISPIGRQLLDPIAEQHALHRPLVEIYGGNLRSLYLFGGNLHSDVGTNNSAYENGKRQTDGIESGCADGKRVIAWLDRAGRVKAIDGGFAMDGERIRFVGDLNAGAGEGLALGIGHVADHAAGADGLRGENGREQKKRGRKQSRGHPHDAQKSCDCVPSVRSIHRSFL